MRSLSEKLSKNWMAVAGIVSGLLQAGLCLYLYLYHCK